VFWDLGTDQTGIRGKAGFTFFVGILMFMSTMMSVLLMFIIERPVFLREYASKTYGITSYFIAKAVVETPFQFLFPIYSIDLESLIMI
jgi:hypothetical protein